jgi:hypothetical protein
MFIMQRFLIKRYWILPPGFEYFLKQNIEQIVSIIEFKYVYNGIFGRKLDYINVKVQL